MKETAAHLCAGWGGETQPHKVLWVSCSGVRGVCFSAHPEAFLQSGDLKVWAPPAQRFLSWQADSLPLCPETHRALHEGNARLFLGGTAASPLSCSAPRLPGQLLHQHSLCWFSPSCASCKFSFLEETMTSTMLVFGFCFFVINSEFPQTHIKLQ